MSYHAPNNGNAMSFTTKNTKRTKEATLSHFCVFCGDFQGFYLCASV
jgi:hypothetical protein